MSNNIVVKSTLPRTASTEEKLNEITNQLQQKYNGPLVKTTLEEIIVNTF